MRQEEVFIVGICGGSGSGKTHLLKQLEHQLPKGKVTSISQDNYYLPKENLAKDENGIVNFDHPDCIDHIQLANDIDALKNGKNIVTEEYTFNNPAITPNEITIESAPILIVEGLFCFYLPKIAEQLDLKIYVDVEEPILLERRIQRDAVERNYDREDVLYRFKNHVKPAYKKYILPFKNKSDLVLRNDTKTQLNKGIDILSVYLKSKIK